MAGVKTTVRGWVARWWLLAQSTLAGTVAWVLARLLDDQRLPFFAPIAAIVVLNFARGERGLHAVRLIIGVAIGIGCGELAVLLAGSTIVSLAAAVFVAMTVTMAVTQNRLALNQAGAAAVLTVIFAGGEAGYERMVDALLGVGVALVFTQVIFTPEPIALVRRAERQALRGLAAELHRTARALARSDHAPSEPDLSRLRELRGQLADVGWAGAASQRAARRSVLWRHRVRPLVPVTENAGHLELLGSSCITFLRTAALTEDRNDRRRLAPHVEDLAETVADLASDPADQATRQRAVRRAIQVAHNVSELTQPVLAPETTAAMTFLLVVFDLLVCAGVNPRLARAAMRGDPEEVPVVGLPAEVRLPLWPRRRREST